MTTTVLQRFFDGDVWYSFRTSPVAIGAAAVAFVCIVCAVFAEWVAPHDPFEMRLQQGETVGITHRDAFGGNFAEEQQ